MRKYVVTLLILTLLLSCSQKVTGGSDNPDFLAGIVQDSSGSPINNATVVVVPENYIPSVDDPSQIKRVTTDTSGTFSIQTTKGEKYTLELYDQDSSLSRIVKGVPSNADTLISVLPATFLTLQVPLTKDLDKATLLFQGTSLALTPSDITKNDSTQLLTLGPVPVGEYGSVLIMDALADTLLQNLSLTEKDTTTLIIDNKGTVKELWHFPLLIGIQEATAIKYGGILSISRQIEKQIAAVEKSFSDDRIDGIYRFSIDTIYTFNGTLAAENVVLPDSVGFRILYDAVSKSTVGNWNRSNRTIIHDHTEFNSDSLFSEGSLIQLMFEFGLARGCYYRSGMEVYSENNPINSEKFEPSPTIMQQRSSTQWAELSIELINHYGNQFSIIPDTARLSCADTIDLVINDRNNRPISGATLSYFGVKPHSLSVDSIATATAVTDSIGLARVHTPLYKSSTHVQQFSNILVEIATQDTTVYHWLPFDEVGAHYHQRGQKRYVKTVLLP